MASFAPLSKEPISNANAAHLWRGLKLRKTTGPLEQRADAGEIPAAVGRVVRSPGEPLDQRTRHDMESRFGHDFGRVRIHTDAEAAESARAVDASAYTIGRQVVFASGMYQPGTLAGQRLLAHELTHVVQQRFREADRFSGGRTDAGGEREARSVATSVALGQPQGSRSWSHQEVSLARDDSNEQFSTPMISFPIAGQAVREGPYPMVNTPLSDSGTGYTRYTFVAPNARFGLPETIQALEQIAAAWKAVHVDGQLLIGDISLQSGGTIPGHASHQKGVDFDIKPVDAVGRGHDMTYRDRRYSLEMTQRLVDGIRGNGVLAVQFILFNDKRVRNVSPWPAHDEHLHVRFNEPRAITPLKSFK